VNGSVYHVDGDRFVPSELARGPWDPRAQHGGAPAALLARAIERHDADAATQVVRLTIELLRPVPLRPLEVRTRTMRPGKKVQLVESSLVDDDVEVARATGLRIRVEELALPDPGDIRDAPSPPAAGSVEPFEALTGVSFGHAMEIVTVAGAISRPGPATVWFRLRVPLIDGEEPSPLQRVAAAADFGNGVSSVVDWAAGWLFINPDLTVYLHRNPDGEWVALEASTLAGSHGVGIAEAALFDERGRIGRSVQGLLFDRR
jgi:hypothetical protein